MTDRELEKAILQYLRQHPRATTDAIAHGIDRYKCVTENKITELVKRGQIEDSGLRAILWKVKDGRRRTKEKT